MALTADPVAQRATCLAAVDDAIRPVGLWHVQQRVGFVGLRVVVVVVIAADVVVAVVPVVVVVLVKSIFVW